MLRIFRGLAQVTVLCIITNQAFALGHHPMSLMPSELISPAPVSKVPYHGGPVLSHVKLHLVFWSNGVSSDLQSSLASFYGSIVSSSYIDQLTEYSTSTQKIGRGSMGEILTINPVNPSTNLTQADIEKELEAQLQLGKLPKPDADSLYMLHFPEGYQITISFGGSCSTWGADHEAYHSAKFGYMAYAMFPCSESMSSFENLTTMASHELSEAITDPISPLANQPSVAPAAWLTDDGNEIGDLCAWQNTVFNVGSRTFAVQKEFLNSLSGCNPATFN